MGNVELVLVVLAIMFASLFVVALMVSCGFMGYQLYKFAKIIMVFEDDLQDASEAAELASSTLENLLKKPMFFDSPEVKKEVEESMEAVRYMQLQLHSVATRFTERSKQKYMSIEEDNTVAKEESKP